MKATKELTELFDHAIGDLVWIKQKIINSKSSMIVNGKDIDKIDLQDAYIITECHINMYDRESYDVSYILRRDEMWSMIEGSPFVRARTHELCNRAEAVAILKLKAAK